MLTRSQEAPMPRVRREYYVDLREPPARRWREMTEAGDSHGGGAFRRRLGL